MFHAIARRFYPRAREHRIPISHPDVTVNRPKFIKAVGLNFVLLELLFFALFCYLMGALYQQGSSIHNLGILFVDYDGSSIGNAVRDAYRSLQSDGFPSLIEQPVSSFPSLDDLRAAVCSTDYWAALFVSPSASQNLSLAISGAADPYYDKTKALGYIWNQARYPASSDASIAANLLALSDRARMAYIARNGTAILSSLPSNNATALSTFATPWALSSVNLQPTTQGARAIYNTILIVLVLIQDFFFLAALNAVYMQFNIYNKIRPSRIILVRDVISMLFTMIGSLLITAAIWAFKTGWDVSGRQFALNWLVLWLFAHVNFLTIDVFTIWLPPPFVPMMLILWVIINVTSVILPFDLSPSFYKWAYALPAHAAFDALTDVWSNGCNPRLNYALPVLFAYELSSLFWTSLGVYKRCHLAVVAGEIAEQTMKARVDAAVKLQDRLRAKGQLTQPSDGASMSISPDARPAGAEKPPMAGDAADNEDEERRDVEKELEEVDNELSRLNTRASRANNFGPSFQLIGSD